MKRRLSSSILLALLCGVCARGAAPPESPRLLSLKNALAGGRREALAEFWREVARDGAPLVETLKGDEEHPLVTFLWRDAAAEKYVAVFPFARVNPLPHLFERMEGTDLWYRSYRLRRDARFEYLVSAEDSLAPFAAREPWEAGGWMADLRPDPLNPRRFAEPSGGDAPDGEENVNSVVELPGAPPAAAGTQGPTATSTAGS